MQILFCDDDQDVSDLVKDVLERSGHEVVIASSGYEALMRLAGGGIDGVLTDYRMQSGDGGMLAHYCREHGIPCAVVTGLVPDHAQCYLPEGTTIIHKVKMAEMLTGPSVAAFLSDAFGLARD